jgi:hypothetical protein
MCMVNATLHAVRRLHSTALHPISPRPEAPPRPRTRRLSWASESDADAEGARYSRVSAAGQADAPAPAAAPAVRSRTRSRSLSQPRGRLSAGMSSAYCPPQLNRTPCSCAAEPKYLPPPPPGDGCEREYVHRLGFC